MKTIINYKNTGNVGIGTAQPPQTKLHVYSNASSGVALRLENYLTSGESMDGYPHTTWDITALAPDKLVFSTPDYATPVMTMMNNGNVGIGTQSLDEKLNVFGYGKFFDDAGWVAIGFNGAHGYLNSSNDLFINYYTGQNVVIGGGGNDDPNLPATGNLEANYNAYFATHSGNVGIGTTTPISTAKLDVAGDVHIIGDENALVICNLTNPNETRASISVDDNGMRIRTLYDGLGGYYDAIYCNAEYGFVGIGTTTPHEKLEVNGNTFINGIIGIGTDPSNTGLQDYISDGYKLFVQGNILCQRVKVIENVPTADYVFGDKYNLNSLTDVENYIKEHKHLRDIPSAEEMKKNGTDLAEMNALLLKKVEELTLYLIDLQKQVNDLKSKSH